MKIISGCNKIRYPKTIQNHKYYSELYNYDYEFYLDTNILKPYYIKIEKILENLEIYNNVLWLDDDAFFCDKSWNAFSIFSKYKEDFIVSSSPQIRPNVPLFNSGVIFAKNTSKVKSFLKESLNISRKHVLDNYDKINWGNPVGGDQDVLIYLSQTKYFDITKIISPHTTINARPSDFDRKIYPIVHFPGFQNRERAIENFNYIL